MRSIQIDRHGGPEVLAVREVPEPEPRSDHVHIRTVASSINPVDWKTRAWDRGRPPMTLGWDLAGIVIEDATGRLRPGDPVVAMSGQLTTLIGTWAEIVSLPAHLAVRAPRTTTLAEAATLPLAGLTALQALRTLELPSGARVLVIGASGGVGGIFVQLAARAGLRVDGVVSRPEAIDVARGLGADRATARLGDLSGPYDAVFDTASVEPTAAIREAGRYLSITDDPLPPIPGAAKVQVRHDPDGLEELVALVDAGELQLRVGAFFPMDHIQEATRRFEAGGLPGKVVLLF